MARFEHPFQLYTLDHPEAWEQAYVEETGGLFLVHRGDGTNGGLLCLLPAEPTDEPVELSQALIDWSIEVHYPADPADIVLSERDGIEIAYAEAPGDPKTKGSKLRYWIMRQPGITLQVAQMGYGATDRRQRAHANLTLESLVFPEIQPTSPAEFRARVMDIIAKEHPELTAVAEGKWGLEVSDAAGSSRHKIGLENLYRSCLLDAESMGARIREHLEKLFSAPAIIRELPTFAEARPNLMPMLKSVEWLENVTAGDQIARTEFAPGLSLCFVIDQSGQMLFVNETLLREWDVPLERVEELALDNLAGRSAALPMAMIPDDRGKPAGAILTVQDGYTAARFALPDFRERMAEMLGDEYLVGVPNRDFLIAFSRRDRKLVDTLAKQVRADYHQVNHPLSPEVFLVRAERIEVAKL